jgi:hypothetical protein
MLTWATIALAKAVSLLNPTRLMLVDELSLVVIA